MKGTYVPHQLYSEPSLLEGAASVIDIAGNLHREYNGSSTELEADTRAIKNDWNAIGLDLSNAIDLYEQEFKNSLE